jgi:hypothetical protein
MHFTLVLLFCSLISVTTKKIERDVHPASVDGLDALVRRKRQILGVEPNDFLVSRHYTIGNIIVR